MVTNRPGYMQEYCLQHPEYVKKHLNYSKEWHRQHQQIDAVTFHRNYLNTKLDVMSHYSNGSPKCVFCGESDLNKLELDHVNNDGKEHRKIVKSGHQVYYWAKRNGYPAIFQVLCLKCNRLKASMEARE